MSNLTEIQEAIEKLAPRERAELWDWFQAQDFGMGRRKIRVCGQTTAERFIDSCRSSMNL